MLDAAGEVAVLLGRVEQDVKTYIRWGMPVVTFEKMALMTPTSMP